MSEESDYVWFVVLDKSPEWVEEDLYGESMWRTRSDARVRAAALNVHTPGKWCVAVRCFGTHYGGKSLEQYASDLDELERRLDG